MSLRWNDHHHQRGFSKELACSLMLQCRDRSSSGSSSEEETGPLFPIVSSDSNILWQRWHHHVLCTLLSTRRMIPTFVLLSSPSRVALPLSSSSDQRLSCLKCNILYESFSCMELSEASIGKSFWHLFLLLTSLRVPARNCFWPFSIGLICMKRFCRRPGSV